MLLGLNVQVFNWFELNFVLWCAIGIQFHSFASSCLVFPAPSTEGGYPFSIVCIFLAPLSYVNRALCMSLFLGSLFSVAQLFLPFTVVIKNLG